jgi:glyoxylase-like metal-dependent hydrolase (beta-lactamase superfamily II)
VNAIPLAKGTWRVPISRGDRDNVFIVSGDDGLTLVDAGWARSPKIVLAAVTELGYQPRDLRRIVITHAHPDHVRGLAELRELTRSQVLIHPADAAWLSGGRVPAGGRCGSMERSWTVYRYCTGRPSNPTSTSSTTRSSKVATDYASSTLPDTAPGTSVCYTNQPAPCSPATPS